MLSQSGTASFSIWHHVIRMVRLGGVRHGKNDAQKEHFVAHCPVGPLKVVRRPRPPPRGPCHLMVIGVALKNKVIAPLYLFRCQPPHYHVQCQRHFHPLDRAWGALKLMHKRNISWPTMLERDVSKRILMEFTTLSNEIQYIVIRNSKLAGPRRSSSKWINWHSKTTPIAHLARVKGKLVYHTEQSRKKCTDETPIRHFREAVTIVNRLHRESGEERLGTLLTIPTSSQVMSPTPTTSRRLTSSPTQSPWPLHSSPSNVSSRTRSTMTPNSRICIAKHIRFMSITPSEKACQSVSRRCACPIEGSDLLENERCDLLDQVVRS